MANQSPVVAQSAGTVGANEEQLSSRSGSGGGTAVARAPATGRTAGPGYRATPAVPSPMGGTAVAPASNQFFSEEVMGDQPVEVVTTPDTPETVEALHQEVANAGTESGEEFVEATESQLAGTESGPESAVSDLRGIEGYAGQESGEEAVPVTPVLPEAGEAVEGNREEFFPILAALAPALISAIGPTVARGVMSALTPRARTAIAARAARTTRPAGPVPAAGAAVAAVAGAVGRAAGVVARGKSGPSDILGMIAKLLQQAQNKPGGESGIEAEETQQLVQEAAAVIEVIIGTDDRVQITQTTEVPWRRICALRITFPSGATYRGSGFLIGPRAVATAGHCVYLHNQGGWARRVEVIPAANGSARPYGQAESTTFRSVGGWVTGRKPESDYGCIVLPPGAFGGRNLGTFGFAAFDSAALLAQSAVLAGYPGDKPFAELWGMARKFKTVTEKTLIYDHDTMGGQSGTAVYIKRNNQRYVVGIHNYGAAAGNSATRVTEPVYQRLLAWSQL